MIKSAGVVSKKEIADTRVLLRRAEKAVAEYGRLKKTNNELRKKLKKEMNRSLELKRQLISFNPSRFELKRLAALNSLARFRAQPQSIPSHHFFPRDGSMHTRVWL